MVKKLFNKKNVQQYKDYIFKVCGCRSNRSLYKGIVLKTLSIEARFTTQGGYLTKENGYIP